MIGIGVFIKNHAALASLLASSYEARVLSSGGYIEAKPCLILAIKRLQ